MPVVILWIYIHSFGGKRNLAYSLAFCINEKMADVACVRLAISLR